MKFIINIKNKKKNKKKKKLELICVINCIYFDI